MNFLESSLKPKTSLWYYILTILIALIAANFIGAIPYISVIFYQGLQNGFSIQEISANMTNITVLGISKNVALGLLLFSFVVGLFAMIPLFKIFNKRTLKEVINGTNKIRWSHFFWGAGVWTIVMAVLLLIDYLVSPSNFTINFNPVSFVILLLISLVLIPLQTSFEEISFRGYLAQGIAGATGSRIFSIFIPSVLFGLMHSLNPEVAAYGFFSVMPQYIFFGLLFGIMATLDDGIELPMGVHAANNIFLSLFVTNQSSALQTDAIFTQLSMDPMKELISLIICGMLICIFFGRKYKWSFSILSERVTLSEKHEIEDRW